MKVFDLTKHIAMRDRSDWQEWMRLVMADNDNNNVIDLRGMR